MKQFVFDQLVDRENICNLKNEQKIIRKKIKDNAKVIIYAPRNYGKTSLIKNIIIEDFKKEHKNSFVFFADLMEVKDLGSIQGRLRISFEQSFENSFPIKTIISKIKNLLISVRPEITIDSLTGDPSISIRVGHERNKNSIQFIFKLINELSQKVKCLVVLDEFQDIARVTEAQGNFRGAFQDIHDLPIIIMGSKRHILSKIFSNPNAPLAFFGEDLEINPISYEEYYEYINERFRQKDVSIDYESTRYLQDLVHRIPEPINILCHHILEEYHKTKISKDIINTTLKDVLDKKKSRYESYLSTFSKNEEVVLIQLAAKEAVEEPQSKSFITPTNLTARSVGKIFTKLIDAGVIEEIQETYRISDPLFKFYLRHYRTL